MDACISAIASRSYVDFANVPHEQREIHRRLENMARAYADPKRRQRVSPGFQLVKSDNYDREYGRLTASPADHDDARRLHEAVVTLPLRQRRAIGWYYDDNGANPAAQAIELHLSMHGLAECVIAARAALIERVA